MSSFTKELISTDPKLNFFRSSQLCPRFVPVLMLKLRFPLAFGIPLTSERHPTSLTPQSLEPVVNSDMFLKPIMPLNIESSTVAVMLEISKTNTVETLQFENMKCDIEVGFEDKRKLTKGGPSQESM